MAVYITGDCHREWRKLRLFSALRNLTEEDFIIVCGDFGIWDDSDGYESERHLISCLKLEPTVVFVSGNHENFDRLYSDEFEHSRFSWRKSAENTVDNVYHLLRGYVFEFCGKRFWAFGGASSHDVEDGILDPNDYESPGEFRKVVKKWQKENKMFRIKGVSWWERELTNRGRDEPGKRSTGCE